jgi:electron transfer flavoprotein alpha subunit
MLAHDLGTCAVLGCCDVIVCADDMLYVKPVYGGWLERHVSYAPDHPHVVTLSVPTALSAAGDGAKLDEVIELVLGERGGVEGGGPARVSRLELLEPDPQTVDIVHAERIVGVGAGAAREGLLDIVRELAGLLQGAVGATRPVVDDGRLPKERLIGQTGKTVAPDLYLALGVSGSPHHIAGVRDAGRILAVNRDDRAPIHGFSDTGFAGDLAEVLPALLQRIRRWQREEGGRRGGEA